MNNLSSAGSKVKRSPCEKAFNRREIFGLMIKFGSPTLWITISPATVHSPIFLRLANDRQIDFDLLDIPSHTERAKLVANNPVAAAIYYNTIIDEFTNYILGWIDKLNGGIFGHVETFYGMTEEQGTGTLHNHMLAWLRGIKSASELRLLFEDDQFKDDLMKYLDRIIREGFLDTDDFDETVDVSEVSCKNPVNPEDHANDFFYNEALRDDVNKLVKVANTHSCRETCYKYRKTKKCRFGYPREKVSQTEITDEKVIKKKRTHEMVNNFNPALMTCVRSNHDIKFVPSGKDGKILHFMCVIMLLSRNCQVNKYCH